MQASQTALDLIKQFEGCILTAYLDQRGIPTIGYGHIGPDVHIGLTWTQSQANMALVARVNAIANILNGCIVPILTQNQFDALVSLCYNIGQGSFRGSTLLRLLNQRDMAGAADQFLVWDKITVGGVKVLDQGLLNRRQAERELFLS